jgi:hypothetical protein
MKTATKLPEYFFVSSTDGHLYDTRKPDWHKLPPVRSCYQWASRAIEDTVTLKGAMRQKFAWPGGYALFGVTRDGAALCMECMHKEWRQIVWDFLHNASTGWRITGIDATCNCDEAPICDHCGKDII